MITLVLLLINDGWMPLQGSERHWSEHPTVQMVSERIVATIFDGYAIVECHFVFRNNGKDCTLRMAFPDDASHSQEGNDGGFDWFKSWVDGKWADTAIMTVEEEKARFGIRRWRTKTVAFRAHQSRTVRDRYKVRNSTQFLVSSRVQGFDYVLQTGSTWKGPIGKSEIRITFDEKAFGPNLRFVASGRFPSLSDLRAYERTWRAHKNWVSCSGPSEFTASGRTVRFSRTNWKPKEGEDIQLTYGWRPSGSGN